MATRLGARWLFAVAGTAGAVWGVLAYRILWGDTSIVVTRQYVDSLPGLVTLLPVRMVLYGIHLAETFVAKHPYDFSRNHAWIGVLAGVAGWMLAVLGVALARAIVAPLRRGASAPEAEEPT